jgi:hypothetical protein
VEGDEVQTVEDQALPTYIAPRLPGRKPRYPWELWTDGEVHVAKQGEDFACPAESFRTGLHVKARSIGMRVGSRYDSDAGTVAFQFHKKVDGDE